MDIALFDEYNQTYTNKVYDLIPETKEQYVWRELHWAYEQGYAQGKAEALKTGKWIRTAGEYIGDDVSGFYDYHWSCSECEREAIINDWNMYELSDYCPHCGAKMEDE